MRSSPDPFLVFCAAMLILGTCALAVVHAQVPGLPTVLSGNELYRGTAQSGSALQTNVNHLRNSSGYVLATSSGVVNTIMDNRAKYAIATATNTSWTVTFPNTAFDGGEACVTNASAAPLPSVTVIAGPGLQTQTMALPYAAVTLQPGMQDCWLFAATNASGSVGTWYRID